MNYNFINFTDSLKLQYDKCENKIVTIELEPHLLT